MIKALLFAILLLVVGCYSTKVETTKQWEGHYFTVDEMHNATKDMTLDKNESIWILSNNTLKRLLKNTGD